MVFHCALYPHGLTEYIVLTHATTTLHLMCGFRKAFRITSEIISTVLAAMHLKLFGYSFKKYRLASPLLAAYVIAMMLYLITVL